MIFKDHGIQTIGSGGWAEVVGVQDTIKRECAGLHRLGQDARKRLWVSKEQPAVKLREGRAGQEPGSRA